MPKGRKAKSKCQMHQFILKPLNNQCHFNQIITNSFCDAEFDKYSKQKHQKYPSLCLNCPQYNKDKNFSTPTFIIPSEKSYFLQNYQKLKSEHERKVDEYADQISQILIPKPRSKNNYCSVCRQNYEDYLNHIRSQRHKRKINASTYNKHIMSMINKFQAQNNIQKVVFSDKHITNLFQQDLSVEQIDDKEFLEMGMPKKKVKRNQEINNRYYSSQNQNTMRFTSSPLYSQKCLNYMNQQAYENHISIMKNLHNINNFSQIMHLINPTTSYDFFNQQKFHTIQSSLNTINHSSNMVQTNSLTIYYPYFQSNQNFNSNMNPHISFQNYQMDQFQQMMNAHQHLSDIQTTINNSNKLNSSQFQTAVLYPKPSNQFCNANNNDYAFAMTHQNDNSENQKKQIIIIDE